MEHPSGRRRGWLAAVGLVAFLAVAGSLILSLQWVNRPFPGFFLYGNLTVAPYFLPQWSGNQAGLRFLDRVVAVQGQAIPDPRFLYDFVRERPVGAQFVYTVEKGGKTVQQVIRSVKFSFHDWLFSFGIYLLAGLGFLVIGFTPFYLRSRSPAAAPLFFMVSAVFLWFVTTFDFITAQFLPKELRVFALTFTPSAGIHLGLALTQMRDGGRRRWPHLFVIYGTSILLGLFYSLTFDGPLEAWRWALRLGYGYGLLAAVVFLGLLWAALRGPASDLERSRVRVVLCGAILGFFLPTLGTVLTSFLGWEIPYNLSLIPVVFFPLSVAYALLKYSLFDLDIAFRLGLTRGALTGVLLLIYVLLVSLLGVVAGLYEKDPLVPLFFSILVVLIFNPLLRWIEGAVDRYVYRKEYDPAQLRDEVSLILRSLSRQKAITEKYLTLVADRVGIESAWLCFRSRPTEPFLVTSLKGGINGVKEIPPNLPSVWTRHFGVGKKAISKSEVKTDPLYHERGAELETLFAELGSEILIPITLQDEILGFVSFGKKRSGREYSGDDFRLLCSLTDQLALALENGRLYEESERAKERYQRLYDESQALNQRLIEVDRLKKQFVANISHELRTPVCTILGYAEVLRDPAFGGDRRAILERVASHGHELSRLMDDLLQFSRMESGSLDLALREVRVREVFEALETMARRLIKGRPIQFRVDIESSVDTIVTDPEKFQQVLMHFLTNALKFTERGEIAVGIRLLLDKGEPHVEFRVSDTGIGISQRDQEVIFEEFRQLDGSSTRQYGGTGVGLSLCKKLAHSLGGRIEVQSEVGKGSVFSLILPARRPAEVTTRLVEAA
jgi:signal transduction histidine kinase